MFLRRIVFWFIGVEVWVFGRVVFCLDDEPFDAGFCEWCFWVGGTSEDIGDLKPEVVVVMRSVVFLYNECLGHE